MKKQKIWLALCGLIVLCSTVCGDVIPLENYADAEDPNRHVIAHAETQAYPNLSDAYFTDKVWSSASQPRLFAGAYWRDKTPCTGWAVYAFAAPQGRVITSVDFTPNMWMAGGAGTVSYYYNIGTYDGTAIPDVENPASGWCHIATLNTFDYSTVYSLDFTGESVDHVFFAYKLTRTSGEEYWHVMMKADEFDFVTAERAMPSFVLWKSWGTLAQTATVQGNAVTFAQGQNTEGFQWSDGQRGIETYYSTATFNGRKMEDIGKITWQNWTGIEPRLRFVVKDSSGYHAILEADGKGLLSTLSYQVKEIEPGFGYANGDLIS